MKKSRPLAPHLTAYAPQVTSVLSIFHRISGCVLTFSVILAVLLMYLDFAFSEFYWCFESSLVCQTYFYWLFTSLQKFSVVLFCFHFLNGIRHLTWDLTMGLDIKNVSITGLLIVSVTLLVTCII